MTAIASHDLARSAFEVFGATYDHFTSHHNYELWMGAIEAVARRHGLAERGHLLDLGCGTGKSFLPWRARGWTVTGCDQSPAMLAEAERKVGDDVRLVLADVRDMPALGSYDLVLLIDDVANYLAPDELEPAFAGVAANLAPAGVFAFDLNTVHMYETFFATSDVRGDDELLLVWDGRAPVPFAPGSVADAYYDVIAPDGHGRWDRRRALHRQYHHPLEHVRDALRAAGLGLEGVYGQGYEGIFEAGVDEARHTKCVVIARHVGAPVNAERG